MASPAATPSLRERPCDHAVIGWGAAISSSSRRAVCRQFNDGDAAGAVGGATMRNDSCIAILASAGTVDGLLDFVSFDAANINFMIDDQFSSAYTVHFTVMRVMEAALVSFQESGSTGNVNYAHGMSSTPNAMILVTTGETSLNATAAADTAGFAMGFGDSGARQAVCAVRNAFSASALDRGYGYDAEILARLDSTTIDARAALVSFDATNFTLNWLERAGTTQYYFALCIKAETAFVDTFTTRTDTTQFSRSGYGLVPAVAFYMMRDSAKSTQDTQDADDETLSIGGATSPSARSSVGVMMSGGGTATQVSYWQEMDEVGSSYDSAASVIALMDLLGFVAGGQTLVMDDADAVNSFAACLTLGGGGGSQVMWWW